MTLTVWQVRVGDDWKTVDPDLAATFICAKDEFFRRDALRLADVTVPAGFHFVRVLPAVTQGVTPQRLAAARKALQRQRDKSPLFADAIAAEQPTPEERIERIDAGRVANWLEDRKRQAGWWRKARALYRSLPPDRQLAARERWGRRMYPATPYNLMSLLRGFTTPQT